MNVTAHRVPLDQLAHLLCYAPHPETMANFLNGSRPGTTLEAFSLDATNICMPSTGHLVVLWDELPYWETAALTHGVRLCPIDAPIRTGRWDGDVVVQADGPDHLVIELPR